MICFVGTYLLDALFIALLEGEDLIGSLLRVVDFLPSLHLFLLQKRNTVGEELGITLDASKKREQFQIKQCQILFIF